MSGGEGVTAPQPACGAVRVARDDTVDCLRVKAPVFYWKVFDGKLLVLDWKAPVYDWTVPVLD